MSAGRGASRRVHEEGEMERAKEGESERDKSDIIIEREREKQRRQQGDREHDMLRTGGR